MRAIDLSRIKPLDKADLRGVGPAPQLQWLPVVDLRFDDSYQRRITQQGITHLRRIATQFDWRLFAPVIVAPIEGGGFAVIDGQHRAHAAALRGIEQVPCQIVMADRAMQARAFAGMNGNQAIRLAPYQLHRAAVAAGDAKARRVDYVCEQAGVTITTNRPSDQMERGDTVAVMTIYRAIAEHGESVAIAALEAITKAGDGNVGLINALAIMAYAGLFARRKDLMQHDSVLDALDDFDLAACMTAARAAGGKSAEQRTYVAAELEHYLDHHLTITKEKAA
jgi:hypothetical protein